MSTRSTLPRDVGSLDIGHYAFLHLSGSLPHQKYAPCARSNEYLLITLRRLGRATSGATVAEVIEPLANGLLEQRVLPYFSIEDRLLREATSCYWSGGTDAYERIDALLAAPLYLPRRRKTLRGLLRPTKAI